MKKRENHKVKKRSKIRVALYVQHVCKVVNFTSRRWPHQHKLVFVKDFKKEKIKVFTNYKIKSTEDIIVTACVSLSSNF